MRRNLAALLIVALVSVAAVPAQAAPPTGQMGTLRVDWVSTWLQFWFSPGSAAGAQYFTLRASNGWTGRLWAAGDPSTGILMTWTGTEYTFETGSFAPTCETGPLTYHVTADNTDGTGPATNSVTVTPPNCSGGGSDPVPAAPVLTVGSVTDKSASLSWTPVSGATGYRVFRNGAKVADLTGTTWTDSGLQPDTGYTWTVQAYNANGASQQSNAVQATTGTTPELGAPNLKVDSWSDRSVNLSWTPVTGASGYRVYRIPPGGTVGDLIGSPTGTQFTDSNLTPGTSYQYYVLPVGQNGTGQRASNTVTATTNPPPSPPAAPTGVTVTGTQCDRVGLSWQPATGATQYIVSFSPGGTVTTTETTATVFGLAPGSTYHFTVTAKNGGGSSTSTTVTATTAATCGGGGDPPPPTGGGGGFMNFRYSLDCAARTITLMWDPGHDYYWLTENGAPVGGRMDGTVTSYTRTGLDPNTYYTFTLEGGDGVNGETNVQSQSVFVSACSPPTQPPPTSCTVPAAPTLSAEFSNGQVTLSWQPVEHALRYRIYHNEQFVAEVMGTSWTGTYPRDSAQHQYKVQAVNDCGQEGAGATDATSCPSGSALSTPQLTRSDMDSGEVLLEWSPVAGATAYRVLMHRKGITGWDIVATVQGTSWQGSYPRDGQVYEFAVTAITDCAESLPSETASGSCLCSLKDFLVSGAPIPPPPQLPQLQTPVPPAPPVQPGQRSGKTPPAVPTLEVPPDVPPPPPLPPIEDPDLCAWGPCKQEPGEGQQPTGPIEPGSPNLPGTPSLPVTPSPAGTPMTPSAPAGPGSQTLPLTPAAPGSPNAPLTPTGPSTPVAPLVPAAPLAPLPPASPLTPDAPLTPQPPP